MADDMSLEEFAAWCDRKAAQLERPDLTKPLNTVAFYLATEAKKNFDGQHDPYGVPWAAFKSPPSAKRGGPNAKLLRDTGVLMASLAGRGPGHEEQVTSLSLMWGTSVRYAGFHQDGTRTIPARPFVGLTPQYLSRIGDILLDYMRGRLLDAA